MTEIGTTAAALRQLGRLLRACRESKDLTQVELARNLKIDPSRISDAERGKFDAQFSSLDRLARALGLRGGVLELIETGGDGKTGELLRAWRAIPTDALRDDALRLVLATAFPQWAPAAREAAAPTAGAKKARKVLRR